MKLIGRRCGISSTLSMALLRFDTKGPISPCIAFVPTSTLPFSERISPSSLSNLPQHIGTIRTTQKHSSALSSTFDDSYSDGSGEPSDYSPSDLAPDTKTATVDTDEDDATIRDELKRELLLLASVTDRGAYATREETDIIVDLVTQLEALNPTIDPAGSDTWGEWDLVLSNKQVFRSSPFFQAIRAVFGDDGGAQIAENAFDLHDKATSVGRIGRVRQRVEEGGSKIVSMVDLDVGLMAGLPLRVKGTVVTTASVDVTGPDTWEVRVEGTTVNGSNVPFLDQFLDDYPVEIPVGEIYGVIRGGVPVSIMKTFYVDEGIRITRDIDDNFYVYSRV